MTAHGGGLRWCHSLTEGARRSSEERCTGPVRNVNVNANGDLRSLCSLDHLITRLLVTQVVRPFHPESEELHPSGRKDLQEANVLSIYLSLHILLFGGSQGLYFLFPIKSSMDSGKAVHDISDTCITKAVSDQWIFQGFSMSRICVLFKLFLSKPSIHRS